MERRYIPDYFRLMRWQNLLFLAFLMWVMERVCATVLYANGFYEMLPWWYLVLLIGGSVGVAAGGYIINDYFDVKIDRINRADKLIVTQTISKDQAIWAYRIATGIGVLLGLAASWVVRSWALAVIFVFVPGLLWFYSSAYKRQFLLGNLIIALSAALPPILLALANVGWLNCHFAIIMPYLTFSKDIFYWMSGFAMFAFLLTWIREIVKDLQDQAGDRELECHTLPIVLGETWTKIILTLLIAGTSGLIAYFAFTLRAMVAYPWLIPCCLLVLLVCELFLLWTAKIPTDYRRAQLIVKITMFVGILYAFFLHL